jgi:predicted LPLAT superfamily acyltransferase
MMNDEKDLGPRTKLFARRIIRLYVALPKTNTVAQVLGKQMLRSGTSVRTIVKPTAPAPKPNSSPKLATALRKPMKLCTGLS